MSHTPLLSPNWYRVASLRPCLKDGLRVSRQVVRGESWHVITDPLNGRHHRFDTLAWSLVARCDGQRTLDELWAERAHAPHAGDPPTQEETIGVVAQAFAANLLLGDVTPEAAAVIRVRSDRRRRQRLSQVSPMSFRVRLWDPDAFLTAHVRRVAPLFGRAAGWLFAWLMVAALALLVGHGESFARHAQSLAASPRSWLLAWLLFPLVKALHELAHAFAVKHHGGEVHTMGITLLLLTPVPYVDASASNAFADKRQRAQVAAVGVAVELTLATLAFALWILLEPGLMRDSAAVVATVGGLSTLLVNGNPLLRFDGYHVFTDLAELPNLASRSRQWWLAVLKRGVLGTRAPAPPRAARGERRWLALYAPLAWAMQWALLLAAVQVITQWSAPIAAALLLLALWFALLRPLLRVLGWVFTGPELHGLRARALLATTAALGVLLLGVFGAPLAHRTHAPGLVWLPEEALVRPQADGFVTEFTARDGQLVRRGERVARLSNDALLTQLVATTAELERQRIEHAQHFESDALAATQAGDRVAYLEAERDRLQAKVAALDVRAASAGRLALDTQRMRPGMHFSQGELLAQVLPDGGPIVRAFVRNDDIGQVTGRGTVAAVSFAHGGPDVPATRINEVPRASTELPSPALGEAAGGPIALDPADPKGRTAAEPLMSVDLRLPPGTVAPVGARTRVSFEQGDATLAELAAGALRRLFLSQFGR